MATTSAHDLEIMVRPGKTAMPALRTALVAGMRERRRQFWPYAVTVFLIWVSWAMYWQPLPTLNVGVEVPSLTNRRDSGIVDGFGVVAGR